VNNNLLLKHLSEEVNCIARTIANAEYRKITL